MAAEHSCNSTRLGKRVVGTGDASVTDITRTRLTSTENNLTSLHSCNRRRRPTELREPQLRGAGEGDAAAAAPPADEGRVAPEFRPGAQQPRRQPLLGLPRLPGANCFHPNTYARTQS